MKSHFFWVILTLYGALPHLASAHSTQEVKISKWLKPIGLSQWQRYEYGAVETYREYLLGIDDGYVKYELPSLDLTVPKNFPKRKEIPYVQLVESGVQSLLFEYKNYEGQVTSAWYLLLAMGNYSKITPQLLEWVNAKIFPDQDLLKSIYQWLLPTYRSVFEDLTYEEQLLITAKLESARQFVLLACQQKSLKQYKLWLKEHQMSYDEKWCGFFSRRLQKKQWTIKDCLFWIDQIESDLPAIKPKNQASSHYQIIQKINENYMIGCDAKGNYYLLDGSCKELSEAYDFIKVINNDDIAMYVSIDDLEPYHLYIDQTDGTLIKPYLSSWKSWRWVNDSCVTYRDKQGMGVYYIQSGRKICSESELIIPYDHYGIFGVFTEQDGQRSVKFYDANGVERFSDQEFGWYDLRWLFGGEGSELAELDYLSPPASFIPVNDHRYLAITNKEGRKGLLGYGGKVLLPFEYDSLSVTDDPSIFYAYHFRKGREVYYIASDAEICSVIDLSLDKGECSFLKYPMNVIKFPNGDTLFFADTEEKWRLAAAQQMPAWCYAHLSDGERCSGSYRLFNGYAIMDHRMLAPHGWRLAGTDDFDCLLNGGGHDQKVNRILFQESNKGASYRQANGKYIEDKAATHYWLKDGTVKSISVSNDREGLYLKACPNKNTKSDWGDGYYVRCVKD